MPINDGRNPQGTGFTNIQRILDANKNNRLGQTLASNISSNANQARTDLQSNLSAFNTRIGNLAAQREADTARAKAIVNKVQSDPNTISQPEYDEFGKYRNYAYTGPSELAGSQGLLNRAKDAQQLGQYTTSSAGRGELLRRFAGSPQYTTAKQRMDQLFLGGSEGLLKEARRNTQGLGTQAGNQLQSAEAQRLAEQNAANQLGTGLKSDLQTQTTGITGALDTRSKDYGTAQQKALEDVRAAFGASDITPEQAAILGIGEGTRTFGVNPLDFLMEKQAPTVSSVASAKERAQLAALAKLSGTDLSAINPDAPIYDPTKPYGFDKDAFLGNVAQRERFYNEDVANARINSPGGGFDPDTGQSTSGTMPLMDRINNLQKLLSSPYAPTMNDYDYWKSELDKAQGQLKGIQDKYNYSRILK